MTEKELDSLFQKYACMQKSALSGLPAECGHHIVHRSNKILRWDVKNCLPVTLEEHNLIHSGKINDRKIKGIDYKYLHEQKNKSLKNILLEAGISYNEFLRLRYCILIKEISNVGYSKYADRTIESWLSYIYD